jgi:glucan endo-1,6-beta-glucosidase
MISRLSFAALAALSSLSYAWMPDSSLLDKRGFSLFERNVTEREANDKRWMPASGKIRGVNLGSFLVFEPWIANGEWESMGCGGQQSEFDCVRNTGQARSDAAFQKHWDTWITKADLDEMMSYDINTIRIPVGYWINEALVDANSEHFPKVRPWINLGMQN